MNNFGFQHFFIRFAFALVLVLLTYNPSGYSLSHWLIETMPKITPYSALSTLFLAIGWVIYLRATIRSLGPIGLTLAFLLLSCFVWLFFDLGWLTLESVSIFTWIGLILVSFLLAIGMSWSHIRRKMSGQVDTDPIDN